MPVVRLGRRLGVVQPLRQRAQQRVDHQRRLARARHAGHAGEHADREAARSRSRRLCAARAPAASACWLPDWRRWRGTSIVLRPDRYAPVSDVRVAVDVLGRARGDDAPAVHARARPHVDDVVGRRGSCPRRARRPARCCRDRAAASASRAGARCRAGAGRSTARRGCRARRPASCRSASPAGCAAPRRPTASPRCDRATGSRRPTLIEERQPVADLAQDAARRSPSVAATARARARKSCASRIVSAVISVMLLPPTLTKRASLRRRVPSHSSQTRLRHVAVELVVDRLEVLVGRRAPARAAAARTRRSRRSQVRDARPRTPSCTCACGRSSRTQNSTSSPARALEHDRRASSRAACPTARTGRSRSARQTASRIWWKKALLRRSHGSMAPSLQRQLLVGDDQVGVEEHLGADAVAGRAGAGRVVEREQPRRDLRVADAAGGAGELLGEEQVVALAAARS